MWFAFVADRDIGFFWALDLFGLVLALCLAGWIAQPSLETDSTWGRLRCP